MSTETTPLLPDLPSSRAPSEAIVVSSLPVPAITSVTPIRIHFLDNIRTTLTIVLIFHHSLSEILFTKEPKKFEALPLLLFSATTTSALQATFFFVSGYSATLSLSKKTDWQFFMGRTLKVGLPALLYSSIGQFVLFIFLAFGWEDIFGSYKSGWAYIRLCGPVAYVSILMQLDYTHLFFRWIIRRWLESPTRQGVDIAIRVDTKARLFTYVAISSCFLVIFTFLGCVGYGIPLRIIYFVCGYSYDDPKSDAPFSYIIAYWAGVHYPAIKQVIFPRNPKYPWSILLSSLAISYVSMGVAQHMSPSLWKYIRKNLRASPYFGMFVNGGFNFHTIFFLFWTTFNIYIIPFATFIAFSSTSWTKRDLGILTRKTYFQTYIHMIPILVAIYYLQGLQSTAAMMILVGLLGCVGSWTLAAPVFCFSLRD